MRILHTADWHLGKLFYGDYLTQDQAYVLLEQLLPCLREEKVDAVVLAGDVYDRSLPPTEAVELFDEVATKITAEYQLPFLVISGNHDNATRLSFGSRLLQKQKLYLAGELEHLSGPLVLEDEFGPVSFVLLPYAEPALVRHYLQDDSLHGCEAALQALLQKQGAGLTSSRSVCVAHAFVAGGQRSDSERPLSIGGSEQVASSLFQPFTYTALGHLHRPQKVTTETIRYAGSLLKYSFAEARDHKGAVLVDLDEKGHVQQQFLAFTPRHDVRIIEGKFAELMKREDLQRDDYILARVTDENPILDGMHKLREKYPNVRAMETPNRNTLAATARDFDLRQVTEKDLFHSFTQAMRPGQPLTEREKNYVRQLWQELLQEEGED